MPVMLRRTRLAGMGYVPQYDGPAELPRKWIDTTYPALTGNKIILHNGDDLQAAYNAATFGDEIILDKNSTFTGNFVPPAKTGALPSSRPYIVVRTAGTPGVDLPLPGQRITPTLAANYGLAKIITPNVAPALLFENGSSYWWHSNLEISGTPQGSGVTYNFGLVIVGNNETLYTLLPRNEIFDRCYIHGTDTPTLWVQHGLMFNGRALAAVDCWISDLYWPGTEVQAIGGWAGPGPFKWTNCHLEAAGECTLFGGAYPPIANVHPSDFEIRGNHYYKPLSWQGLGYNIKNHAEWKAGQRILFAGNVLENCWPESDQDGHSINLLPGGDSGPGRALGSCPVLTRDITVRYNIVRNVYIALEAAANPFAACSHHLRGLSVHDNLFYNINQCWPSRPSDNTYALKLSDDLKHVRVQHNTFVRATTTQGALFEISRDLGRSYASDIAFVDNIGSGCPPGGDFSSNGSAGSGNGVDALNVFAQSSGLPTGWRADHNGFANDNMEGDPRQVPGNYYQPDEASVLFNADYSLQAGSPFNQAGLSSDGKSYLGADTATVFSKTTGVVI